MTKDIVDSVLAARYLREGEQTFEDVCRRVSRALTDNNYKRERYFDAMMALEFLPNSPTLMNAGTPMGQLSACFTLPVEDDMEGIFDAIKWGALIHKSGGGTGYNFSKLRAEGEKVASTDGVASGPVSFMKVFNSATDVIKQGGRRRGANMGILDIDHPDIMKFLKSKSVEGDISNFNISVMVDDNFMSVACNRGEGINLTPEQEEVWQAVVDGIWNNGEPGILFYDTINDNNPTPWLGPITTTNPCGEQPLLPFESCVLGSINVSKLVEDGEFLWSRFSELVELGVDFLNDVLDHNTFPIPQIKEATLKTRKIGLGIMGLHDALIKLGIPYHSREASYFSERIAATMEEVSHKHSVYLADLSEVYPAHTYPAPRMRNAATTTIAPTGSISILAGCSSGIEPNFSYVYERRNTVGESFKVIHPLFKEALYDLNLGKEVEEWVISEMFSKGSIQHIDLLPEPFRCLFVTALDIGGYIHIDIQSAFQRHIDASISKTINVPEDTTKEEIRDLIEYAWISGCKGLTIYRNNSRNDVVLALDNKKEEKDVHVCEGNCKCKGKYDRPKSLVGHTHKVKSGCCDLYVTVNVDDNNNPVEVFIQTGGTGCNASNVALGRMISVALQNGISVNDVVKQLAKVNCVSAIKNKNSEGKSCADVVGKCLLANYSKTVEEDSFPSCPECGAKLDFGEGCNQGICKHCGWSGCS